MEDPELKPSAGLWSPEVIERQPAHIVTLIHGTFTQNASWPQLRSDVSKALRTDVEFREFAWSGSNSHRGRIIAGDALRDFLTTGISQFPAARHFIIAHSHGGNVAIRALQTPTLSDRISGLACLGTPFLHVLPRRSVDIQFGPAVTMFFGSVILALLCSVLLSNQGLTSIHSWILRVLLAISVFSSSVVGIVTCTTVLFPSDRGKRLAQELNCTLPENFNLFIVRAPGDEASLALAASPMLAYISALLSRAILNTQVIVNSLLTLLTPQRHRLAAAIMALAVLLVMLVDSSGRGVGRTISVDTRNPTHILHRDDEADSRQHRFDRANSDIGRVIAGSHFPKKREPVESSFFRPSKPFIVWPPQYFVEYLESFVPTFVPLYISKPVVYVIGFAAYVIPIVLAYGAFCAVPVSIITIGSACLLLPFGRGFFGYCNTVDLFADVTPGGRWVVQNVRLDLLYESGYFPVHSSLHDHPYVTDILAKWIAERGHRREIE